MCGNPAYHRRSAVARRGGWLRTGGLGRHSKAVARADGATEVPATLLSYAPAISRQLQIVPVSAQEPGKLVQLNLPVGISAYDHPHCARQTHARARDCSFLKWLSNGRTIPERQIR